MNFGPKGSNLSVGEVVGIFSRESSFKPKVIYQKRTTSDPLESETLFLDASFSERLLCWTPNWSQENAVTSTARWWDNVLNKGMSAREACLLDVEQLLLGNTIYP